MGLFKRGAVVDTARWAAKVYHGYQKRAPFVTMDGVGSTMLMTRYAREAAAPPGGSAERTLATLPKLGEDGDIRSVAHLLT